MYGHELLLLDRWTEGKVRFVPPCSPFFFHLEDQVRASAAADRYVEVILQMSAAEGKFQGLIIKKLPGHLKQATPIDNALVFSWSLDAALLRRRRAPKSVDLCPYRLFSLLTFLLNAT